MILSTADSLVSELIVRKLNLGIIRPAEMELSDAMHAEDGRTRFIPF